MNQIVSLLIFLGLEDKTKDLFLFINSPGGGLVSGMAIRNAMEVVIPAVHTICIGVAVSMASFILVSGEITKRIAYPHAWRQ